MGAFLDHPKVEKTTHSDVGNNASLAYKYGTSSMQGWRIEMEDAHSAVTAIPGFDGWSFFAVFDGHAGSKVAAYSKDHLLDTVMQTAEFKKLAERKNQLDQLNAEELELVRVGLTKGFLTLDDIMQKINETEDHEKSGTTAVAAILTPHHIIFANLGDSRGVLSRKSEIISTTDHKPYLEKERERIVKAGGSVMIQRVNGSLAVSRAFGDYEYKSVPNLPQNEQLVSPEPDVYILERNKDEDEFLVLACDGIYDVLENDELCKIIRSRLALTEDLTKVTSDILDVCLSKGSRDNMTLILIVFDDASFKINPTEVEEEKKWIEKMKSKIEEFLDSNEGKNVETWDAEIVSSWLKDKNLDYNKPGGLHLARPLIHSALEKRTPPTPKPRDSAHQETTSQF